MIADFNNGSSTNGSDWFSETLENLISAINWLGLDIQSPTPIPTVNDIVKNFLLNTYDNVDATTGEVGKVRVIDLIEGATDQLDELLTSLEGINRPAALVSLRTTLQDLVPYLRGTIVVMREVSDFLANYYDFVDAKTDLVNNDYALDFGTLAFNVLTGETDTSRLHMPWAFNGIPAPANISDTTAPTLTSNTPVDGANSVALNSNIVMNFSEAIKAGAGNIVITNSTTPSDTRTISVTDLTQVTINGSKLTINPTDNLALNTAYNITMAAGVIKDISNNAFSGVNSSTAFDFTTLASAPTTNPPTAWEQIQDVGNLIGLNIPFLSNPTELANLILNKPTNLVTFKPDFETMLNSALANFNSDIQIVDLFDAIATIPQLAFLSPAAANVDFPLKVQPNISIIPRIEVGYDNYAIINSANPNVNILSGLYISDNATYASNGTLISDLPELEASIDLALKLFLGAGYKPVLYADLGIGAGIESDWSIDLVDPNKDGKIRGAEILNWPNLAGNANFVVDLYADTVISGIESNYTFSLVDANIFNFNTAVI